MLNQRTITIRVKTGSSWVRIENCTLKFWTHYKDDYSRWEDKEVYSIDLRELILPSWAECYRDTIKSYIDNNPNKLHRTINGMVLNVE